MGADFDFEIVYENNLDMQMTMHECRMVSRV